MTKQKLYIETYGCQMNVVDSEVVVAIMQKQDFEVTDRPEHADLILVNTCSIRDNAESRVRARLRDFASMKKSREELRIGVIGCMAERLKEQLIEEEKSVDLVIGPDAYRELPSLLNRVDEGEKGINTYLSLEETYDDILPVRLDQNHVSAFVSIMRGCNNFCAYCVVPYTRGRERSRDPETILQEVRELLDRGYKEVTLLGQNVNSYRWKTADGKKDIRFEELLTRVAGLDPKLRVRFATSHPKDMSDELLRTIARYPNLCRSIHLPVQSGSNAVLRRMKRGYTREMYMDRISAIRKYLPGASISTDIIAGFCGETREEHLETLSLMEWAGFDFAFMFKYSERPDTLASRKFKDDVTDEDKTKRLNEIIALQNRLSLKSKQADIGSSVEVLVEGESKKSKDKLYGRTSQNKVVVFPKEQFRTGEYVQVTIDRCTSATLLGQAEGTNTPEQNQKQ
ncbi:MAG: tRNA (N6-isopentenyl adenosine(37)-C2)-methylthiotransferase MiaB [Bacteroidota bacterium]